MNVSLILRPTGIMQLTSGNLGGIYEISDIYEVYEIYEVGYLVQVICIFSDWIWHPSGSVIKRC